MSNIAYQIELKDYIVKVLEMGFSEDDVRSVLRSVGWAEDDIERGVMHAKAILEKDWEKSAGSSSNEKIPVIQSNILINAEPAPLLLESAIEQKEIYLPDESHLLPAMSKTTLSLFLALLKKRVEILKSRVPERKNKRKALRLLIPSKEKLFSIVAADLPRPFLLTAPSWRTVFKLHSQFIVEKIFGRLETALVVSGRLIILPIAFFSSLGVALKRLVYAGAARWQAPGSKTVKNDSLMPEVALTIGKFPEHIILFDIFKLAGRMFRTRRLRTFLTISGISVGIGTILFLVSFGYGLQNVLFERITTEEALLTLDVVPPADNAIVTIDGAMVDKIKEMNGVSGVSSMIALNGEMIFGESSAAGFIYAVDPSYAKLAGIRLMSGQLTDGNDSNAVIISSAAAKLLGWSDPPESALGKEMKFTIAIPKGDNGEVETVSLNESYKVAGVVDDSFSVFAYLQAGQINGKKLPPYSQLKVKVKDTSLLEPVRDQILSSGLLVSMLSETVDQAKKVFNVVKIILGLFGVITLIVSAIGMLNTMTIALLERTQEVGIMKAVGASNLDIWKLFLAEAVIMGFLGGVGGIVIGFVTATVFNYGINAMARAFGGQSLNLFQAPAWFVLTIVAFSSCIGVITGLWPARRASRLDPLDALKYK